MTRPISSVTGACGFIGTGYMLIYPGARDGLRDTVRWYKDQGWI